MIYTLIYIASHIVYFLNAEPNQCLHIAFGLSSIYFLRHYLFIFRQSEREGERVGAKHQCVVVSSSPPTGDLACNPGIYPD